MNKLGDDNEGELNPNQRGLIYLIPFVLLRILWNFITWPVRAVAKLVRRVLDRYRGDETTDAVGYLLTSEQRAYVLEGIRDLKGMAAEYFHRIEDESIRAPLQAQTFILLAKLESVLEAKPVP